MKPDDASRDVDTNIQSPDISLAVAVWYGSEAEMVLPQRCRSRVSCSTRVPGNGPVIFAGYEWNIRTQIL